MSESTVSSRFTRLLRVTWPFLVLVLAAAVIFGRMITPGFGVTIVIITLVVYVYFAIVRPD